MLNGDVLWRPRSRCADRPARRTGAHGDAGAGDESRTRAPTAWCRSTVTPSVLRVRREAQPRPDRHEPDQRRCVRARARDPARLIPPDRNVSIEREVWPLLVGNGLYGYAADSYWLDIGTPARYLQGTFDILEGNVAPGVGERLGRPAFLAVQERAGRRPRRSRRRVVERGCASRGARASAASSCLCRRRERWGRATVERSVRPQRRRRWGGDARSRLYRRRRRTVGAAPRSPAGGDRGGRHDQRGQHDHPRRAYLPRRDTARRRAEILTMPMSHERIPTQHPRRRS